MKFDPSEHQLDAIDLRILDLLQENCKQPLAAIGEKVGLTASSVMERIHKLEQAGVITGYAAQVDARRLGKDVSAFIGVSINHPQAISAFEREIGPIADVLECHHVTGDHTLLLKVKTENGKPRASDRSHARHRRRDAHRDDGRAVHPHRAHPGRSGARGGERPATFATTAEPALAAGGGEHG